MILSDVVDELHDDHGLAHTSTTESANLTTLGERADEVDDLNASLKNRSGSVLIDQSRSGTVNWIVFVGFDVTSQVHSVTSDIEDTTEDAFTHRDRNWIARIGDLHVTTKTFRGGHGHRSHPAVTEVLLHFEHELHVFINHFVSDFESVVDCGQFVRAGEIGVDHWSDNLNDSSFVVSHDCVRCAGRERDVLFECQAGGGNFEQFVRNSRLAQLVVFKRKIFDELLGVVRSTLHRHHAGAVLRRARL